MIAVFEFLLLAILIAIACGAVILAIKNSNKKDDN